MILQGNCLDKLKELEDNTVDQLVTDPPYGINFMGKSWDNFEKGQKQQQDLRDNGEFDVVDLGHKMISGHPTYKFEGMTQFFTPIWKECLRVMKPNSYGFVMCIPRQDCLSRMILSLEQAGFAINFSPIYHTFATGFPKNLNIGKKITKDIEKLMNEQGIEDIEWED